jgi:hypothetical protein
MSLVSLFHSLPSKFRVLVMASVLGSLIIPPLLVSPAVAAVPASGLVSSWPADGNANDAVGPNNGTLQGGAGFASGVTEQAFSFNGRDASVSIGNPQSLHLGGSDFTVAAWVNFANLTSGSPCGGPGCDQAIVSKMVPGNSDGWALLKQSDNHVWFCLGNGSNGCIPNTPTTVRSSTVVQAGAWYCVVGVRGATQGLALYVDGVREDSKPLPSYVDRDSTGLIFSSMANSFMNGRMDDVNIWNRGLSSSEIASLCSVDAANGLVSSWPADGNANDVVGANNGTLQGGAGYLPSITGQAFSLNGSTGYVSVGNPPSLRLSGMDFTVAAWVNFTDLGKPGDGPACFGPGCDEAILGKIGGDGVNQSGWYLLKQSDNHIWFCLGAPNNGCQPWVATTVRSKDVVNVNQWYCVVAERSAPPSPGNQGQISLYIDGALQQSNALTSFQDNDTADLNIGRQGTAYMKGRIDDVRIWNRALSASDARAACNPDPLIASSGTTFNALKGISFNGAVAAFTDPDTAATSGEYSATIGWGDGSSSPGTVNSSGDTFIVNGPHTYVQEGTYAVVVTITDGDNADNTATARSTARVDAALTITHIGATANEQRQAAAGVTFTDADPAGALSQYTGTISWGDGTNSPASFTTNPFGGFAAGGVHMYASPGTYQVKVTINDVGGASTSATTTLTVPSES